MNQLAIIKYLAQGLQQEQVASIVGCTPGYISRLVQQQDIIEQIEYYKLQYTQDEKDKQEEEDQYTRLAKKARLHLEEHMPYAEYKDVLKLLEILERRKEVKVPQQQTNIQQNVTILQVPAAAVPEFTVNSNNEVIGLGDQSLAPMSAQGVRQVFNDYKAKEEAKKKELEKQKAKDIEDATIVDLDRPL